VWDGSRLILQADNDFDSDGRALMDEFSDAISACLKDVDDGNIVVEKIAHLRHPKIPRARSRYLTVLMSVFQPCGGWGFFPFFSDSGPNPVAGIQVASHS
jgi:hypothetical protein